MQIILFTSNFHGHVEAMEDEEQCKLSKLDRHSIFVINDVLQYSYIFNGKKRRKRLILFQKPIC